MIELSQVTACLITKESIYPSEVLQRVSSFPFGEILVLTNCDSPHRKHEIFAKAKHDLIYYNDDDALCPIAELAWISNPSKINLATKQRHFDAYEGHKTAVGFGWGAIFPKSVLPSLKRYTDVYGEDEVYRRETERILMCLNYPQNRFVLPIQDLPSAYAPDRLSNQPGHYDFIQIVEDRCANILMER